MTQRTGQCMCGAVAFTADVPDRFAACFCKMCQRWSSGVFMGVHCTGIQITRGQEHVTVFKSSEWAERAFCNRCGSNLYYHMPETGGPAVALGTLDDTSGMRNAIRFYTDKRPEGIIMGGDAKDLTEAECLAMFGGGDV